MFAPSISSTRAVQDARSRLSCPTRTRELSLRAQRSPALSAAAGFTLLELLIVVGIIGLLMVLIAPAFTTIKGGTDVTSAAYTIKGVLDTARTYAKANNTYTWVGFAGSIGTDSHRNRFSAGDCRFQRRNGPWNQREPVGTRLTSHQASHRRKVNEIRQCRISATPGRPPT